MTEFSSAFGERISNFLNYRTARGYKRETYLRYFIKFDLWCIENHPAQTELSRVLVLDRINDTAISGYNTAPAGSINAAVCKIPLCCWGGSVYLAGEIYSTQKQSDGLPF